jgi:hypothetical protein
MLQEQLSKVAVGDVHKQLGNPQIRLRTEHGIQQLETLLGELQDTIKEWTKSYQHYARQRAAKDNEAWANLIALLASIQERVSMLSQDGAGAIASLQARTVLEELEQEMQNLRSISEEIAMLQWRLRRSLHERQSNLSVLRAHTNTSDDSLHTMKILPSIKVQIDQKWRFLEPN